MKKHNSYLVIVFFAMAGILSYSCQQNQRESGVPIYTDWTLTDSIIERAVQEELNHHPEVPSHLIDVTSVNGVVALTGSIDNLLAKERAVEIARAVKGVKGVVNHLEVKPVAIPDERIHDMIVAALFDDPITESYEYEIEVKDGRVELKGVVDSWPEVEHSGHVAKSIRGVKEVRNNVVFKYEAGPRSDLDILADIQEIMFNDLYIDNDLVKVEVTGGTVRLTGTVGSASERNRAVVKSYVPGVDTVIAENLQVKMWARDPKLRHKKYVERSDEEIREAIRTAFIIDPAVEGLDLRVMVKNGHVRLEGVVDHLKAKNAAEDDAESVIGVNRVVNRIKVRPEKVYSNKVLHEKVVTAMDFHPYLSQYDFDIEVSNGQVCIDGEVNTYYEKEIATEVVSKVGGVVEIQNNLDVRDQHNYPYTLGLYPGIEPVITEPDERTDNQIREAIETELWWSPFVNEDEVHVMVDAGHAILTGTVDTPLEKKYAAVNAIEGGAEGVSNKLRIR